MASTPKRKLRPEEDPTYNPMDDLTPPGNLPMPVKTEKAPSPKPPAPKPAPRPPVRDKEKVKQDSATKKYSGGGSTSSASSRADGIVSKGKTKGTMVKMRYGGTC